MAMCGRRQDQHRKARFWNLDPALQGFQIDLAADASLEAIAFGILMGTRGLYGVGGRFRPLLASFRGAADVFNNDAKKTTNH